MIIHQGFERKLALSSHTINDVIKYYDFAPMMNFFPLSPSSIPDIIQDLKKLERMLAVKHYKFGLLYAGKGQKDENSIYANSIFFYIWEYLW